MAVSSGWKNILVIKTALKKIIYGWLKSQKSGSVLREKYLVQMECQPKTEYGNSWWKGSPQQRKDLATKNIVVPVKKQNKEMNTGLNIFLEFSTLSCHLWETCNRFWTPAHILC